MQLPQNTWNDKNLINTLNANGVVIMPTDTIYGIVGKALNESTVLRIYDIKKRAPEKPCIVLIGEVKELGKFSIVSSEEQKNIIKNFSIPTSFILDCLDDRLSYLHRNTKTLAFRLPLSEDLCNLLLQTGPLVASSANPEGLMPAKNIEEAKNYFGNSVDLYIDGGENAGKHSKLIKLNNDGSVIVLRE